jgi:hypothetical protein
LSQSGSTRWAADDDDDAEEGDGEGKELKGLELAAFRLLGVRGRVGERGVAAAPHKRSAPGMVWTGRPEEER